jgi:hypothetical protein
VPDAGSADNWVASGQTVAVNGDGSALGILGASTNGAATGNLIIHYTNGTTATEPITMSDWYANQPPIGGDILATTSWVQPSGVPLAPHQVSIYAITVPLEPGETVSAVTLPAASAAPTALHIFAFGFAPLFGSSPPGAKPPKKNKHHKPKKKTHHKHRHHHRHKHHRRHKHHH